MENYTKGVFNDTKGIKEYLTKYYYMNFKVMSFGKLLIYKIAFLAVLTPLALAAGPNFDPSVELEIEERVVNLNTVISVKYTDQVRNQVYYYVEKHKKSSEALLGEMQRYLPLFEQFIAERNLPEELKLLPIMESGVRSNATSRVGAVGLWQFMSRTARSMGLKINRYVDERRDPIKATKAALDYLTDMYNLYDDWTLALAAYNCGQGNVNKAIRKAGGKRDYWAIQKYLPRETRNYIPKFIAITYTYEYYNFHGIVPDELDNDYLNTATAKVFGKLSLKTLAKELNMDYDMVRSLNPSYLRGYIPTSEGENLITLPINKMYDFLDQFGSFDDLLAVGKLSSDPHKVEYSFEDLEALEEEVKEVRENIDGIENLPTLTFSATHSQSNKNIVNKALSTNAALNNQRKTKLVKLRRGTSLSDIAVTYGVDISNLIAWNDYSNANPPRRGDFVKVKF